MSFEIKDQNKEIAVITITVTKEEMAEAMKKAAEMTGSEEEGANRQYAINFEASKAIQAVFEEQGLKLASEPKVDVKDEENGDVEITVTCPLVPEVTLGQYTGFNIIKEAVEVKDEEVLEEVNRQINAQSLWEDVDTPAEKGNQVLIDFVGEKEGVPFEGGTANDYPLVLGSNSFIPGFEDQLIGIKAGEKKEIEVTFPEDYFEPTLAGAPVVFKITCKAVQTPVQPELSDAFVAKLGHEQIKTVDELKDITKQQLVQMKQQEADNKQAMAILDKVIEQAQVEVPQAMIDSQVAQHLNELQQQIQQYGMDFNQYMEMTGQTLDDFKKQMAPSAEQEIKQALILAAIAEKEQIQADQEEINAEYQLLSNVYQMPAEQLQMFVPAQAVAAQLIQRKAIDFLRNNNEK